MHYVSNMSRIRLSVFWNSYGDNRPECFEKRSFQVYYSISMYTLPKKIKPFEGHKTFLLHKQSTQFNSLQIASAFKLCY